MSTIDERVRKIVVDLLGCSEQDCTNGARFIEDLGAAEDDESNEVSEIFMALEEEFGVDIPDAAQKKITTVGEAIAYLKSAGAQ